MESEKISSFQLAILMYASIAITGILYLPGHMFLYAGRDFWISPIFSSIFGLLSILASYKLIMLYPGHSIIVYSKVILGRTFGSMWTAVLLLFILGIAIQSIWQYAEFVNAYFLPRTPRIVVLAGLGIICSYAVRQGVEVVARTSQIITPIIIIVFIFVFILLLPDAKVKHALPIFGGGILPTVKGSFLSNLWFSEFILLTFFLPSVKNLKTFPKWGFLSWFLVVLTMVMMNLISLLTAGEATGNLIAPLINVIQYINVGHFLTHIEALVMAFWIAGAFIKMNVFFYVMTAGTAEWFKLKDYRPIVIPIVLLTILLAIWFVPNTASYSVYLRTIDSILGPAVFCLLPLLLWMAAILRKGRKKPA